MNWDRVQGEWKQLSSQVKSKWAKLTDDDLKNVSATCFGRRCFGTCQGQDSNECLLTLYKCSRQD